jgi:hypothetical protein
MRRTVKYSLMNYKRNENILKELKTEPILDKILKYKTNSVQYVDRMKNDRLSRRLNVTNLMD